jgi:ATP phosphoribosyltransferase
VNNIKIALPKGRLAKQVLELLQTVGYTFDIDVSSRSLIQEDTTNKYQFMFVKPSDVITYVEEGVCDIGFVGKDNILEEQADIYELLDIGIGSCKMVIAGYRGQTLNQTKTLKVATKYPTIATRYLSQMNIPSSIVTLQGSVELGPLVGLSDVIVDIYETGSTLRANNLVVLQDLFPITTRLIANKASYRTKRSMIEPLVTTLSNRGE